MAKRKTETEIPAEDEPIKTRPVRVHETRSYIEEQPVDIDAEFTESPLEPDLFSGFNEIITTNQQATLRIWRLPNYEMDGRASPNGTEREYCGSINYNVEDSSVLDQIQARVPMGGTVQLELRADGEIKKRGLLKLMKQAPATNPNYGGQQGTRVIIQNPEAAPVAKPFDGVREAFGLLRDMGETMKAVLPAPVPVAAPQQEATEPASLKDRLLEGVILKLVDSPKPDSLERVADLLTGGKETSWLDSLVTGLAPHAGPFLNQIGSGLNALLFRFATGAPIAAGSTPMQATSSGVITDGQPAPASMDPVEYAWKRVLNRILEDMFEHCAAIERGALGIDVHSSAEAVVDLGSRFEENPQIIAIIGQLLVASPIEVIDLCVMIVAPVVQERVLSLKANQAAITWLVELQTETRGILADNDSPLVNEKEERTNENESGNTE